MMIEKKKLKEVMSLTDGIFQHFPSTVPWESVMNDNLNLLYVGTHSGEKYITSFVENYLDVTGHITTAGLNTLASAISSLFGYNWDKLYAAVVSSDYDPIENYRMTEDGTDTTQRGTTSTTLQNSADNFGTSTTSSSIYGYNSGSPTPDSSQTTNTSTNTNIHGAEDMGGTDTHHLTRKGNIGVTTSQQMIDSEIKLREYNFWLQVFRDIDSILCLKVY